jgi:uncharacterized spore protein YtfJ
MTDQPENTGPDQTASGVTDKALDTIGQVLRQLTSSATVEAAFGPPTTAGDRTVIPVAETFCGAGFGMGGGQGPTPEGAVGGGFGGGAGGATRSRPVAIIVIEPEGVSVRPIVDMTQIVLAAFSVSVFGLLWARRIARRGRQVGAGKVLLSPRNLAKLMRS